MRRYSEAVKLDVKRRMSPPHWQSVARIFEEPGIHVITLYEWRKALRLHREMVPAFEKDPQGWSAIDKFTVVLETAGLNTTERSAYCRERGLFPSSRGSDGGRHPRMPPTCQSSPCRRSPASLPSRRGNGSLKHSAPRTSGRSSGSFRSCVAREKLWPRLQRWHRLRSFSKPRVSNDKPYSESLFRTAKLRPDYPRRPLASNHEACHWLESFVDWYSHRYRPRGIMFVTPHQRHIDDVDRGCLNSSSGIIVPGSPSNRL